MTAYVELMVDGTVPVHARVTQGWDGFQVPFTLACSTEDYMILEDRDGGVSQEDGWSEYRAWKLEEPDWLREHFRTVFLFIIWHDEDGYDVALYPDFQSALAETQNWPGEPGYYSRPFDASTKGPYLSWWTVGIEPPNDGACTYGHIVELVVNRRGSER